MFPTWAARSYERRRTRTLPSLEGSGYGAGLTPAGLRFVEPCLEPLRKPRSSYRHIPRKIVSPLRNYPILQGDLGSGQTCYRRIDETVVSLTAPLSFWTECQREKERKRRDPNFSGRASWLSFHLSNRRIHNHQR